MKATLTCQALAAGKTVFVEKPLALSDDDLDPVLKVVSTTGNDRLMVRLNRRFSPMLNELRRSFGLRGLPTLASYRVNAGRLESGSWHAKNDTGGSRFEG